MRSIRIMLLAVAVFTATSLFAQEKTDSIKVYGNCGMCKNRIEKAVGKIDGVTAVTWDTKTKMMAVTYDAGKTSNDAVQQKVASVGHDTEKYRAEDKVYEKLPGCCLYERKKAEKEDEHKGHNH